MEILITCFFLFLAICVAGYFIHRTFALDNIRSHLLNENIKLREQCKDLEKQQTQSKNLSVEAQQILHDMTAHGTSIVKITPISPTEVFWRSPK
jgi:hypothetical protein